MRFALILLLVLLATGCGSGSDRPSVEATSTTPRSTRQTRPLTIGAVKRTFAQHGIRLQNTLLKAGFYVGTTPTYVDVATVVLIFNSPVAATAYWKGVPRRLPHDNPLGRPATTERVENVVVLVPLNPLRIRAIVTAAATDL